MDDQDKDDLNMLRDARRFAERLPTPELLENLRVQASALRQPMHAVRVTRLPSEEAAATDAVRVEVERLSKITAALLDLSATQANTAEQARKTADRATNVIIGLTVVLVVLTYVLAADALGWPPFG